MYIRNQFLAGINYFELLDVKRFKYELMHDDKLDVSSDPILSKIELDLWRTHYFKISAGILYARKGYRWDGPSGPTVDDRYNMRASLYHDIGYQITSEKLLQKFCKSIKNINWWFLIKFRRAIDKMFRTILKTDDAGFIRRMGYYVSVRIVGPFFAYFNKE